MARARPRGSIRQIGPISWEVRIPGPQGREYHYAHGTRRDALRLQTELLRAIDTGTHAPPARWTVATYLRHWLEQVEPNLSPQTARGYRRNVEVHLVPALGETPLTKLSPIEIQRAYTRWLREPRPRAGREAAPLSARTVLQLHAILRGYPRAIWVWVKDVVVDRRPTATYGVPSRLSVHSPIAQLPGAQHPPHQERSDPEQHRIHFVSFRAASTSATWPLRRRTSMMVLTSGQP